MLEDIQDRISEGLGVHALMDAETYITYSNEPADSVLSNFVISSESRDSKEEASAYFWYDYFRQVDKSMYSDIYWRRNAQYETYYDYDNQKTLHRIKCRFSLKNRGCATGG